MKFENLIEEITKKAGCRAESTGETDSPEYKLIFRFGDKEERKQELTIAPFSEEGQNFVRLITNVAKKQDLTTHKLSSFLELNSSLRYGAFALYQGNLAIICTSDHKDEADYPRIVNKVKYLVRMADEFEKSLVGLDRN